MSMVPEPCQECHLHAKGDLNSESLEWLMELKDKQPIWSPLNEINTTGLKRKLPMSMKKNYNIEINGRLWSLWGHKRIHKIPQSNKRLVMATTVMALCTARVIRLNLWTSALMDTIRTNGRKFYKQSIKKLQFGCKEFPLENLNTECNLEGISFQVMAKIVQTGHLYTTDPKSQTNLAFALKNFFTFYQFGILECCTQILGFGFIHGPQGGYFMFDAQSVGHPLFAESVSSPYLLRTNHLQILLYCLIITLNVPYLNAAFALYHIQEQINQPNHTKIETKSTNDYALKSPLILPTTFCKTRSVLSLKSQSSKRSVNNRAFDFSNQQCANNPHKVTTKTKYRRKKHNILKSVVEKNLIKPLVDADLEDDEDLLIKKDFVRMICSDTKVSLMPWELPKSKDFSCNLLDALVMGPNNCLALKNLL